MGTVPQTVSTPVLLPSTNALGDDFAPPRQIYFAFLPPLLVLGGLLGWAMSDEAGFLLGSVVGTAVALITLWDWLIRQGPTRLSTLLGMTLLLGYCGGSLNTWFTLPRRGSLSAWFGLDPGVLARGMSGVLISSAFLYFFGEIYERPIFGRDFRFHFDQRTRTLIYLATFGMVGGYAAHMITFGGPVSRGMHVSIPGAFLTWLYPPIAALAIAAFLTASRGKDRFFTAITAVILLGMFALVGRRNAVYTTMEILFVLGLIGFRWRQKMFRNLLLLIILISVVVGGALTFMIFRIVAGRHTEQTVGQRIRGASKLIRKGGAYTVASKATKTNVESRTFVIVFLADILDASFRMTPALGADAIGLTQLAIPHILYPDKNLWFMEEGLVDYQFHFSFGDQPNSVLTAGATDFGFIGMILYPLLAVAIARGIINFMARRIKLVPRLFVVLSLIFLMLQTELTLTSYVEGFRDTILFGFVLAIFFALPTPKWTS